VSRSSNKEEGKTHKGKIPPSNEGAYNTIAKAAKNGMTRHYPLPGSMHNIYRVWEGGRRTIYPLDEELEELEDAVGSTSAGLRFFPAADSTAVASSSPTSLTSASVSLRRPSEAKSA
jgi:hypothetical protein